MFVPIFKLHQGHEVENTGYKIGSYVLGGTTGISKNQPRVVALIWRKHDWKGLGSILTRGQILAVTKRQMYVVV